MNYYVLASDGQKYGPADVNVLNQWVREGRLFPNTMLEPESGGPAVEAGSVPGIAFQSQPTATAQPGQPQQPSGMGTPFQSPAGSPGFTQYPRGVAYGGDLPDSVKRKFNWGAFLLTWIWGLNHKQPILLLALVVGFIPIVGGLIGLGISIWAGINGNQWAWSSGRFGTVQEMEDCQVIWVKWGIGVLVIGLIAACGFGLMAAGLGGLQGARR